MAGKGLIVSIAVPCFVLHFGKELSDPDSSLVKFNLFSNGLLFNCVLSIQ